MHHGSRRYFALKVIGMTDRYTQLEADPAYWRGRAATRFALAARAGSDSEMLKHLSLGAAYERQAVERNRELLSRPISATPLLVEQAPAGTIAAVERLHGPNGAVARMRMPKLADGSGAVL